MPNFVKKKGLDWLKMTNFGHFASFSAKWGSDWLKMANFTWFITFLIFCQKASHLSRNLRNFHFWGGGPLLFFFSFSTFWICFIPNWLKMTYNGEFCWKSPLDWLKTVNFGHFAGFYLKLAIISWVFQLFWFLSHQTG